MKRKCDIYRGMCVTHNAAEGHSQVTRKSKTPTDTERLDWLSVPQNWHSFGIFLLSAGGRKGLREYIDAAMRSARAGRGRAGK